jgi:hypothetical protein
MFQALQKEEVWTDFKNDILPFYATKYGGEFLYVYLWRSSANFTLAYVFIVRSFLSQLKN